MAKFSTASTYIWQLDTCQNPNGGQRFSPTRTPTTENNTIKNNSINIFDSWTLVTVPMMDIFLINMNTMNTINNNLLDCWTLVRIPMMDRGFQVLESAPDLIVLDLSNLQFYCFVKTMEFGQYRVSQKVTFWITGLSASFANWLLTMAGLHRGFKQATIISAMSTSSNSGSNFVLGHINWI